ncbi:hypothetical protein ZEAMMB73_Zm00001d019188 [Zea mays]|uniref:Uncharacterized protein n=1 Tax=Zea mays TaxID=4577 RepID=A0A1D6HW32_MAIZE|nr:hypothetical protein ZEAMMB73_Zm00001d019188 [Zea mays]
MIKKFNPNVWELPEKMSLDALMLEPVNKDFWGYFGFNVKLSGFEATSIYDLLRHFISTCHCLKLGHALESSEMSRTYKAMRLM